VGDGRAWIEFVDRMGRLRAETAIGLGIGKPVLLDGEREEPGVVVRTMTGRRREDINNNEKK
jgi:hypothetical protein